jgi:hypothetical protein
VFNFDPVQERHTRVQADKAAWLKGAATPPALLVKLFNIAMCSQDDVWEEGPYGGLVRIPHSRMSQRGKDAIRSHESTERVVGAGTDQEDVLERKEKTGLHCPLKAAQMIITLYGQEAFDFMKRDAGEDEADNVNTKHMSIQMHAKEKRFTLDDKQSDFHEKSNDDWAADLGL